MADVPVTIADVAAAAGVSVATVSKVINDRYGVAEQTSARVREVIEQLGYTSSLVAQSLRSRRSNVIGVIASDIEPFNAELLKGAARGLRGTGYDLIVFSDCGRYEDQAGWERRSLARVSALTDGSVLVTPSSVDVISSRPLVAVDHNVRSTTLPTVDSDNLSGGVTATEYLIGLGHRRIGFLAGRRDLESSRLRQQGYRRALETAGIPFDEDLVRVGGYRAESARTAARELLDRDDVRPRSSRRTTRRGSRRSPPRASSGSRCPRICPWSGSTTSRSRRSPSRRSPRSTSRSSAWASRRCGWCSTSSTIPRGTSSR